MSKRTANKYQLFEPPTAEERRLLEQDILERGIQVPIEYDETGNVLDGHTRLEIADEHGLEYPYEVRAFASEEAKKTHVIMLNMARRQLKPHQWGGAFEQLKRLRGVREGPGRPAKGDNQVNFTQLCEEVGVKPETAKKRVEQYEAYRRLPAKERKAVDAGEKTVRSATRKHEQKRKREEAAKTAALKGLFSVVMADPGWTYGSPTVTGGADQHYACMTTDEICAVPVREHVTDDAVCFLHVPPALLPDAMRVLKAWSFDYKTAVAWVKDKPTAGLGVYVRGQFELVLIATRGSMVPNATARPVNVVHAPVGEHSAKPDALYELAERMYPGQQYLELFSRRERKGWTTWGAEA